MEKYLQAHEKFSGKYLRYVATAYNDFEKDQKNIEDFYILVREKSQEIEINFVPNLAPGERQLPGGGTSLGRAVTYLVSKKECKIIKSHYQR